MRNSGCLPIDGSEMVKLYGTPPTRVLRVIWLLNELGLEYEMLPVDLMQGEHQQQDFLFLNPAGKAPILVDGSLVVTESAAIQPYLAEKYPQVGFIPAAVEDRSQMYRWIFFLVTEIEQPLWRIARHTFIYPEEQQLPQDVDLARQECVEMVAVLEGHMAEREFMGGGDQRRAGNGDGGCGHGRSPPCKIWLQHCMRSTGLDTMPGHRIAADGVRPRGADGEGVVASEPGVNLHPADL